MTNQHPITPPPELVTQWRNAAPALGVLRDAWISTEAARWGANQELEACCNYFEDHLRDGIAKDLRAARRPKPPSLKEQALLQLDTLSADLTMHGMGCDLFQIRRALEALPND